LRWIFDAEVFQMNTTQQLLVISSLVVLFGLAGCAGMSRQGQNTAVGAGVGAVGGSVLTGGSAIGTMGGAVVGGVIGHEVNKTK